ncbi:hypothetical protein N9B24_00070 [bacterium]|nr:hypothetical protein [bacterium]
MKWRTENLPLGRFFYAVSNLTETVRLLKADGPSPAKQPIILITQEANTAYF